MPFQTKLPASVTRFLKRDPVAAIGKLFELPTNLGEQFIEDILNIMSSSIFYLGRLSSLGDNPKIVLITGGHTRQ
jgi:hypothetical protein